VPVVNDHLAVDLAFLLRLFVRAYINAKVTFGGAGGATKLSVTSVLNPFLESSKRLVNLTFGQQVEIQNY
jgi:accessory colonization factor AcfC